MAQYHFHEEHHLWEIEKLHEVFHSSVIRSRVRRETRHLVQIMIYAISVVK